MPGDVTAERGGARSRSRAARPHDDRRHGGAVGRARRGGVALFAVSSYDTDVLLVRDEHLDRASPRCARRARGRLDCRGDGARPRPRRQRRAAPPHPRHRQPVAGVGAGARRAARPSARSSRSTCPASANRRRSTAARADAPSALAGAVVAFLDELGLGARRTSRATRSAAGSRSSSPKRGRTALGLRAVARRASGTAGSTPTRSARCATRRRVARRLDAPARDALRRARRQGARRSAQLVAQAGRLPPDDAVGAARNLAAARAGSRRSTAMARAALHRRGGRCGAPVTIAWGEKDRLLLPRQAERARGRSRRRGT